MSEDLKELFILNIPNSKNQKFFYLMEIIYSIPDNIKISIFLKQIRKIVPDLYNDDNFIKLSFENFIQQPNDMNLSILKSLKRNDLFNKEIGVLAS